MDAILLKYRNEFLSLRALLICFTHRRFLLHFDKVSPTLVVEFSIAAVVEERNLQLPVQVTFHLTHLQRPNAICTVHRQVLLVVCTIGCLPWRTRWREMRKKGEWTKRKKHTYTPKNIQELCLNWKEVTSAHDTILFSYILYELDESLAQFAVVSFHCGLSIFTMCVLTANHVVELWCGH